MTVQEWAKKLNGIEYPANELDTFNRELEADGIIAAYGASDDLLEFRGVIDDEIGAWEGTVVKIAQRDKGQYIIFDEEENRDSAEFNKKEIAAMKKVRAIWCPKDGDDIYASWEIDINVPYKNFDIMEDGELYCRGILFEAKELDK
jgi:hypothetical protein